ncbi:helix-turn-helix domain-containing protein [Carnobacterium sp.]|uniref:helix-turn-helix domain-containing protein n=1 Tax=Carnobacterium sp. TaxID=48221 RepID=UPI002FC74856
MITIGEKIKESRKTKNLTQQNLADKLNVSRSAVSNWEIGRNYPDIQMIVLISDLLDISLDQLLKGDEEVVEKIANDTKMRKKQSYKIKILYGLIAVIAFIGLYFGFLRFQNSDITSNSQIESVEIFKNKIKVKTNLPPYRSISGYMLANSKDPWELDLSILTTLDFSMKNEEIITIEIDDKDIEGIMGVNIVKQGSKIIKTIPINNDNKK